VRALLADGLVDHLHLWLYPLTLGAGPRLFADGAPPLSLELEQANPLANGVVLLHLRRSA
jgi:dihydrofolate reductase